MASAAMKIVGLIQPVEGLMFVLMGALKGAGDTRTTMKVSLISIWLLRVPCAYTFAIPAGLGVTGAWLGMFADIAFRALMYFLRFRGRKWMSVKI